MACDIYTIYPVHWAEMALCRMWSWPGVPSFSIGVSYVIAPLIITIYSAILVNHMTREYDTWAAGALPGLCNDTITILTDISPGSKRACLLFGPILFTIISWVLEPILLRWAIDGKRSASRILVMSSFLWSFTLISALTHIVSLMASAATLGAAHLLEACVPTIPWPTGIPAIYEDAPMGGLIFLWAISLVRLPCAMLLVTWRDGTTFDTKRGRNPAFTLLKVPAKPTDPEQGLFDDNESDEVVLSVPPSTQPPHPDPTMAPVSQKRRLHRVRIDTDTTTNA